MRCPRSHSYSVADQDLNPGSVNPEPTFTSNHYRRLSGSTWGFEFEQRSPSNRLSLESGSANRMPSRGHLPRSSHLQTEREPPHADTSGTDSGHVPLLTLLLTGLFFPVFLSDIDTQEPRIGTDRPQLENM